MILEFVHVHFVTVSLSFLLGCKTSQEEPECVYFVQRVKKRILPQLLNLSKMGPTSEQRFLICFSKHFPSSVPRDQTIEDMCLEYLGFVYTIHEGLKNQQKSKQSLEILKNSHLMRMHKLLALHKLFKILQVEINLILK